MTRMGRCTALVLAVVTAILMVTTGAFALEPGKDGYYLTGSGVRVKTVVLIDVKVYAISHFMKSLPEHKSKRAVIDAATDKRFVWKFLRDVPSEKIREALKEGYAKNNYGDAGKIGQATGVFADEMKEGTPVTISYNHEKKETTFTAGGKSATIAGEDFMKATWSLWFGNLDQPKLGDALISKL